MAQLQAGTVSITNASNRVVASAGTDWTAVVPGQSLFSLPGTTATLMGILTKTAPGSSLSGNWEITLAAALTLGTLAGQTYLIEKDYVTVTISGTNYYLPTLANTDVQYAQIFTRLVTVLGAALAALAAGGGGGGGGGVTLPNNMRARPGTGPGTGQLQMKNKDQNLWYDHELAGASGPGTVVIDDANRGGEL